MTENGKTGVFTVAALAALVVSLVARPADPGRTEQDDSGERFFEAFDPLDAASLEIIGYDENDSALAGFEVAQHDGIWSIPSHENYPADASDQLAQAAADVVDLIKGTKVSDNPADHGLYGVADPVDAETDAAGTGTRVTLRDAGQGVLADIIVGKDVKDAPNLRYARVPGRDRVYTTQLSTERLSTTFEDWVEDDLLELEPQDVRRIVINDYYVDEIAQRLVEREVIQLDFDPNEARWTMANLVETEQLDAAKAAAIATALDDLRFIDVYRKPDGLSAELKTSESMQLDREGIASLQARGFYVTQGRLLSNEGETIVQKDDGITYVLRFGEIAVPRRAAGGLGDEEPPAAGDEGASRYVFIMASFDPMFVPEPEYEAVPDVLEASEEVDEEAVAAAHTERERILDDNQEKLEAWERRIAEGQERVDVLNERFADWYYVIPDSVYQDVRLTRDDLVEAVEAAPTEDGSGTGAETRDG